MENVYQTLEQVMTRLNTAAAEVAACVEVLESIKFEVERAADTEIIDDELVSQFMREDGAINTDPEIEFETNTNERYGRVEVIVEGSVSNLEELIEDSVREFLKWQRKKQGGQQ